MGGGEGMEMERRESEKLEIDRGIDRERDRERESVRQIAPLKTSGYLELLRHAPQPL